MALVTSDPLLTVSQAARLLGVHANTIRTWTETGRLTAFRINERGDRRYRTSDVRALLVADGVPAAATADVAEDAELAIFSRIAAALSASSLPSGVATAAVEGLRTNLGIERAAVYAADADDTTLELGAHAGLPDLARSVPSDDPSAWPAERDMAVLPLRAGRAVVGLLVLDAAAAAAMSEPFVHSLTASIAAHLANARLLVRSRLEVRRARALRSVTKELTGNLDLSRVVAEIVERTRSMFGAQRAGIWLFDGTPHPVPLVTRNLSDEFLRRSTEITPTSRAIGVQALEQRRTLWMRDAHLDTAVGEMRTAYAEEGIRTVCMAPLISRGHGLGVIGLYHDHDRSWPEEEIALAQAFADQAAVAIQNARLYQSVEVHAGRMRSIQDLSARLNRLTDVRAIGEAIVDQASTIAAYNDIRVYRVDHARRICEPVAFTREMLGVDHSTTAELLTLAVGEGFTGWVAEHGEALLINDTLADPRGKTIDGTDEVPESMLIVPMVYESRTLGVIVLSQLGVDRFSDDDLQTMGIFAGYAAQAMANATTYEQLTEQTAELARHAESQRRLLEVNQRLMWTLDQRDVLDTIADGLGEVVPYDAVSIHRVERETGATHAVLSRDSGDPADPSAAPASRGLIDWAVTNREAVLANDVRSDPRAHAASDATASGIAAIVVPLIADGEVLGALSLQRDAGPRAEFSEADFQLVQLFAAQASIAVRNADTHHAMSQRAETDALTGLRNHGAFQRDLAAAVERAADSSGAPLSVLMMDLDRFKAYNDHHGHPAGDELLRRVAAALNDAARAGDGVYRYGGDEFVLILMAASPADAVRVAERLRGAVAALTIADATPVTITVGIAGMPGDAQDRAGLISAADAALYFGKRSGADRVVRADELPRRRRTDASDGPDASAERDAGLDAA